MRISDWISDVCSSDLPLLTDRVESSTGAPSLMTIIMRRSSVRLIRRLCAQRSASPSMFSLSSPSRIIRPRLRRARRQRSADHTSELQSLIRLSYPVFCLSKYFLFLPFFSSFSFFLLLFFFFSFFFFSFFFIFFFFFFIY